jgi:iron complex outermembrane recepter protein
MISIVDDVRVRPCTAPACGARSQTRFARSPFVGNLCGAAVLQAMISMGCVLYSDAAVSTESDYADTTQPSSAAAANKNNQASANEPAQLEEVLVTAQKRSERLQDVPVPVTIVSTDALIDSNQLRLQDYYTAIPGLTVTPDQYGTPQLAIRGLITGSNTNPTVGMTINDVPYGSSSLLALGFGAPDIDPSDLARIEVLRGPQGTLYGANSLGGLVKYVTLDPSTDGFSGRVQAGTTTIYNGVGLGYSFRVGVNVPLSDTLAIRASGFTRQDPGYIDNVLTGQRGVNKLDSDGGMLSVLWRPSEVLSLKLTALVQHSSADGSFDVQPTLGDLNQSIAQGGGGFSRTSQVYSATTTAKLGSIDLTAITGYSILRFSEGVDLSSLLGSLNESVFGVSGAPSTTEGRTSKFTQELRLSTPIGERVDWLLGAFFNYEDSSSQLQDVYATVPATGQYLGTLVRFSYPTTYTDLAAFTDLTFHVTDRFDVQIGGRENENRQTYRESDSGPFVPLVENSPSPFISPEVNSKDDSFTYLVTPRFKVSSDLMVYARLASGYRAGGPNTSSGNYAFPATYQPDKTQNYEIGVKSDVLDHRLSFDASLYYILWKDIQLPVLNPVNSITYYVNGSEAKSQGVELSVQAKPLTGLTIAAWVAWNDARLTRPLPPNAAVAASSGDRLPFSTPFSSNLSAKETFSLTNRVTGFVGGSVSYVGDRKGNFPSIFATSLERPDLPAYAKVDLTAGANYGSWSLNLFVTNVADRRGVLDGGTDIYPPDAYFYIQPRTLGLSVVRSF